MLHYSNSNSLKSSNFHTSVSISFSPTAFSFEVFLVTFDRSSSVNGSVFISRRLIISHSCSFSFSFIVWEFFHLLLLVSICWISFSHWWVHVSVRSLLIPKEFVFLISVLEVFLYLQMHLLLADAIFSVSLFCRKVIYQWLCKRLSDYFSRYNPLIRHWMNYMIYSFYTIFPFLFIIK